MAEEKAESAKAATLFLSYARADEVFARRLANALEQAGHTIWWDALIEGGAAFGRSIADALDSADAVLVLWSKTSVDSDWVKDEAAQGRERQRLIPLSLDGTPPPLGFRQYQVIDLSRWHGRRAAPQMAAIERAIASALGQRPANGIARPSAVSRRGLLAGGSAAALALAGGGAWLAWDRGLVGGSEPLSIAVLPFKNLSGDPGQAYLADGLTEEVRSALARNAGLMVLAGTSSNTVKDMAGDAKAIARKLGVSYLLDGSVQREGDVVRVGASLTNGRTGFSEWSQRVERKLGDIFAFESEMARTVANALSVRVATDDPAPGGTRNVRAYEAYSRGRALYNLAKDEDTDRLAKADYEVAIAADPNFALAHAWLSRVLASIAASEASASELRPLYDAAIAEARQATKLAPTLADGHLALGYALFAGRLDVRGARPSYDQAYRYGGGDADILQFYAIYTARARRFALAQEAIDRALALDGLNPRAWRTAGSIALASNRPDKALAHYDKALTLNPSFSTAHALKGYALIDLKRWKDARASLEEEPSAMFRLTGLAILGGNTGDKALAEKSFGELVATQGDAALYQQAQVLAQWGRSSEALDRLERARAVGDSGLIALVTDPFLAPLTREPRFRALVRSIGFA